MSPVEVRSPGKGATASRERGRVLVLAGLIAGALGVYLAFGRSSGSEDTQRNLLPYQALARTLPTQEQQVYAGIRQALASLESERSRLSRWPGVSTLTAAGGPALAPGTSFSWQQFQERATVNYLGVPADPASPAWLLVIQEPEPNTPPDPAPLDDEHHRLPNGTTLHIYIWTHRYGGRVPVQFVPQPQTEGWTEIFNVPPNPVLPVRR